MVSRKNCSKNISKVATYGAAISTLFVTTEVQADLLQLTFNGGQQTFAMTSNSFFGYLGIDQVDPNVDAFRFSNLLSVDPFGNSSTSSCPLRWMQRNYFGVPEFDVVNKSEVLSATNFFGEFEYIDFSQHPFADYVAFRTIDNNMGWFKIDWPSFELHIESGQYGNDGERLRVGYVLGDVDENGTVDLLDVNGFVDLLVNGKYSLSADMNVDGALDLTDVDKFVETIQQP